MSGLLAKRSREVSDHRAGDSGRQIVKRILLHFSPAQLDLVLIVGIEYCAFGLTS